jgi:hypothetical protein
MSSPALTKTRIALGVLMATATLATTGVAASLALAQNESDRSTAAEVAGNDDQTAGSEEPTARAPHSARSKTTNSKQQPATKKATFAPAAKPTPATKPVHTKTKGS